MKKKFTTWKEWTADKKFRETYGLGGTKYVNLKPEIKEAVAGALAQWSIGIAEENAVRDMARTGTLTDQDVLDYALTSQSLVFKRQRDQREAEFQRSLVGLTPKQRDLKIASRNAVRAVFARAVDRIADKRAKATRKLSERQQFETVRSRAVSSVLRRNAVEPSVSEFLLGVAEFDYDQRIVSELKERHGIDGRVARSIVSQINTALAFL